LTQEILFLLFMTAELIAIMILYNFVIIPLNAKATISRWETKMLAGDFDTVAMLEEYTDNLIELQVGIIKQVVPQIMGGYLSQGIQQLKKDPDNQLAVSTADFIDELPFPAQLIANKFLPQIIKGISGNAQAEVKPDEPIASFNPGIIKS